MSESSRPIGEDDLQALVDGRIAPERRPAVEDYLARHPDAAARVGAYASHRQLLRESLKPRFDAPIPARLRVEHVADARMHRRGRWGSLAASIAAAVVAGGAGGWFARDLADATPPRAQVAVAAHKVFVADGRRPVEIRAEAQDQLVQWLSNRMQTPLAVPDLSDLGLRFMGGRLLPTSAGPAAQLMYDDDAGRRVTIFVEPNAKGLQQDNRFDRVDQVEAMSWADGRLAFTIAAASGREQLAQVGDRVRRQLPSRSL